MYCRDGGSEKSFQYWAIPSAIWDSEFDFLDRVKGQMRDGDLLLAEVRLKGPWDPVSESLTEKRLRFGPLDNIGIEFEESRFSYETTEPGLGDFPGTRTTLARYGPLEIAGRVYSVAKLEYIHEYDRAEFLQKVSTLGFSVVAVFGETGARHLVVVLTLAY